MNKVFLIGRLTREPELRHTTSGTACCQISIAVNRQKQKDKEQETDFINVVVWDKLGENVAKYQTKGNQIAVEGRLQTSKYKDKDDKTIYKTEVIATSVQFLDTAKKEKQEEPKQEDVYEKFGNNITVEQLDEQMELPF